LLTSVVVAFAIVLFPSVIIFYYVIIIAYYKVFVNRFTPPECDISESGFHRVNFCEFKCNAPFNLTPHRTGWSV
jgi:hypothetical protein